jgi:DNA (cytosine-5)-methyltransferase 1
MEQSVMKHLGDITKINGAEIPIVDCIIGGSPCQDLSIAGKRAGLSGERSGLFMEQLRIVKEMRKRDQEENGRTDQFIRPRFMVWENVPGAFSSNNGKDFQAVLTEIVRIVEPDAPDVPMPDKGKWTKSGCIYDEMGRWSVAWRVHDAQFWGVPQRRKRIALVADFGGLAAPEVQFERKGLSWNPEPSGTERKRVAGTASDRADKPSTVAIECEQLRDADAERTERIGI